VVVGAGRSRHATAPGGSRGGGERVGEDLKGDWEQGELVRAGAVLAVVKVVAHQAVVVAGEGVVKVGAVLMTAFRLRRGGQPPLLEAVQAAPLPKQR